MIVTRCKFKLGEITMFEGENVKMVFYPEYDTSIPEDQRFNKYTPSGRFEMLVNNKNVIDRMKIGKKYYFDITEVINTENV